MTLNFEYFFYISTHELSPTLEIIFQFKLRELSNNHLGHTRFWPILTLMTIF